MNNFFGTIIFRSLRTNLKSAIEIPRVSRTFVRHNSQSEASVKVTILGAAGELGKSVALLLKNSSSIDELCLHDSTPLEGFANDLDYIDTKCSVTAYCGTQNSQQALSKSTVVAVLSGVQCQAKIPLPNLFEKNAPLVKEAALDISKYAPKALIAIATEPLNSIVPMFCEIVKKQGSFNPCAVFGITTIDVIRANRLMSELLGIQPECVKVPVIGGHSRKTIIPLLSRASPCNELTNQEIEDVSDLVREANESMHKLRCPEGAYLSNAFAAARFILSLVKAVRGNDDVDECAFVKSRVHGILKYMATPLSLGPGGIIKNHGIPVLTDYETCLFENAAPILLEEIQIGQCEGGRPMEVVDCKLQDKPVCDPCQPKPKCPPDHCKRTDCK